MAQTLVGQSVAGWAATKAATTDDLMVAMSAACWVARTADWRVCSWVEKSVSQSAQTSAGQSVGDWAVMRAETRDDLKVSMMAECWVARTAESLEGRLAVTTAGDLAHQRAGSSEWTMDAQPVVATAVLRAARMADLSVDLRAVPKVAWWADSRAAEMVAPRDGRLAAHLGGKRAESKVSHWAETRAVR